MLAAMTEGRAVPMLRVEQEEELFDREQVLGRDVSSVFPKTIQEQEESRRAAARQLIGGKQFISESELLEIRKSQGATEPDASAPPMKPLAEVLAEARQAKQEEFEEVWRSMKEGKNRPLNEDEALFLQAVQEGEQKREQQVQQQESEELEAFREAVKAAVVRKVTASAASSHLEAEEGRELGLARAESGPGSQAGSEAAQQKRRGGGAAADGKPDRKRHRPLLKPVIRRQCVRGGAAAAGAGSAGAARGAKLDDGSGEGAVPAEAEPAEEGQGLAGLLGGYGSDEESS